MRRYLPLSRLSLLLLLLLLFSPGLVQASWQPPPPPPDEQPRANPNYLIELQVTPTVISAIGQAVTWNVSITNLTNEPLQLDAFTVALDAAAQLDSLSFEQGDAQINGQDVVITPGEIAPNDTIVFVVLADFPGDQSEATEVCGRLRGVPPPIDVCATVLPAVLVEGDNARSSTVLLWVFPFIFLNLLGGWLVMRLSQRSE